VGNAVTIWLAFWAIRRKYELDYDLDNAAHILRWLMVSLGFVVALLPGHGLGLVRLLAGILLIAFLAWPNFAYHLTQLLRRGRLLSGGRADKP
jgi:hypothetical protein